MKLGNLKRLALVIVVCIIINGLMVVRIHAAEEYSFKVYNSTEDVIEQILVSEDKKTWGKFDIGRGIKPGQTVTLIWDETTNDEGCEQYVKAIYDDGSESKPAKFDFCEKGLDLEF